MVTLAEDCPNHGRPILRWPYFQYVGNPGTTYGHCAWCMKPFRVTQDVPNHEGGEGNGHAG